MEKAASGVGMQEAKAMRLMACAETLVPREANKRILIFIVAYNHATKIVQVLERIPKQVLSRNCQVLIIDDKSGDQTFEIAHAYRDSNVCMNLVVLQNVENQGYGGNQKIGFQYAIENNFFAIALLHGDGQYAPEMLEALFAPVLNGEAEAVFGSRMARPHDALAGGMPFYKFVGNKILTSVQNCLLGTMLTEFHSGYRVYSVEALKGIPFHFNTNDFHFDTEIIIQLLLKGCKVCEIAIPTYYGDEVCYVNGLSYAWNVIKATVGVILHRMGIFYRRQYDVDAVTVNYELKLGYPSSHSFAIKEVRAGTRVLDIGCGGGHVGMELERKGCNVHGVDQFEFEGNIDRGITGDRFVKVNLNQDELPFDLDEFDYILLLDILEHLEDPYRLIDRIRKQSRHKKPTVLISVPNVAFFPVRLQLLFGNFNYGKRGILDFTHKRLFTYQSIREMLVQSGYKIESIRGVPAPYPLAIGRNGLSKALIAINGCLILPFPGLFSYQIFVRAVPLHTVDQLLGLALRKPLSGE